MPIKWPKNGIVGCRIGGSRGSDLVPNRLEMRAATTTATATAARSPVVMTIARLGCGKRRDVEDGVHQCSDATPLTSTVIEARRCRWQTSAPNPHEAASAYTHQTTKRPKQFVGSYVILAIMLLCIGNLIIALL